MSRRFVVQWHTVPLPSGALDVHYDLMVEDADALVTFQLLAPPDAAARRVAGRRSFDHRRRYLDYEGPISGGRGEVVIHDRGDCIDRLGDPRSPAWRAEFAGARLRGEYQLEELGGDERPVSGAAGPDRESAAVWFGRCDAAQRLGAGAGQLVAGPAFGPTERAPCAARPGAYAVVFAEQRRVATVRVPQARHYLPGGGLEPGESPLVGLRREVREELGWELEVLAELGGADQHVWLADRGRCVNKRGVYYLARPGPERGEPSEVDHELVWLSPDEARATLVHESQRWAVERGLAALPAEAQGAPDA